MYLWCSQFSSFFILKFATNNNNNNNNNSIKISIKDIKNLRRELEKFWNARVKIIPLVVGSLGAMPKQFGNNRLKEIGVTTELGQVQKTVSLETARILRAVLEI